MFSLLPLEGSLVAKLALPHCSKIEIDRLFAFTPLNGWINS